jgi:hypothetical protein
MTTSQTIDQSRNVSSTSTEVAAIPLIIPVIIGWLQVYGPTIAMVLGSAAALVTLAKELYGIITKSSDQYKTLQPDQKRQVDKLSGELASGISSGDSAVVAASLNGLASVYEEAAKNATNAADANLASATAQRLRAVAAGVSNGTIKAGNVNYTKDNTKVEEGAKSNSEKGISFNPVITPGTVINSVIELQALITTVAKHLGLDKLDDKNAVEIFKTLQGMGIPAEMIEKAFVAYYEKVQGLSPEASATKAKEITEAASAKQQEAALPAATPQAEAQMAV